LLPNYVVSDRMTGEKVSRLVGSYAEVKALLETVYSANRDNLIVCTYSDEIPTFRGPGDDSPS
jgi:hypothetical protein